MSANTIVGLDIGSTSIRAIEAVSNKDGAVLHRFGQIELPSGVVVGGVVKDPRAVTSALRQLWSASDFGTKNVAIGVTHQQVVVREIDLADVPARERKRALPHLVRDVLPLPVDQAVIDFYPLGRPGETPNTIRGLLVAAPKDAILDTIHAVEDAGLRVSQVDLSCFAALRAAAHLADDTEAMLDIGATVTNIIVHLDGTPKVVRAIPRGGAEITKMLAERLDVDLSVAEQMKLQVGLSPTDDPVVAGVIEEALRPFLTEIRTSLSYFVQLGPENRVRRLALVGGGSHMLGLPELMSNSLGVPTYLSDPLRRITDSRKGRHDDLRQSRSSASVAIGLTLGGSTTPGISSQIDGIRRPTPAGTRFVDIRASLMPDEVLSSRRTDVVRRRALIGVAAAVAVVIAGFGASWMQTSSARDDLHDLHGSNAALAAQQLKYAPLAKAQSEVRGAKSQLRTVMVGDLDWKTMLTTLRDKAPSDVALTSVTATVPSAAGNANAAPAAQQATTDPLNGSGKSAAGTMTVVGTAGSKSSVAAYSDALSTIKGLTSVLVTTVSAGDTTGKNRGGVTFTLTATITTDALGGRFTPTAKTGGR